MTRKEVETVLAALNAIANPNAAIRHAKAICEKQLAYYATMRGQLSDQYDADYFTWGAHP